MFAFQLLRVGAALCFIGHGAFGLITKAGWLPYFAVVGIPEPWAWRLMPWVGAVDVLVGTWVLFAPRRLPVLYMVVWGAWTAALRPLAGEPVFEAIERAGNYGVPLALLLLSSRTGGARWRALGDRLAPANPTASPVALVRSVLLWTTCLLLAGHGALGAITGKGMLTTHYATVGLPSATTAWVGWAEIALAGLVALRPAPALLVLVAVWKIASESLFLAAGDPIWEFIERAGSYAAPLALAVLMAASARLRAGGPRSVSVEREGAVA